MPTRPAGPCNHPGCPKLAGRRGRCARHAAQQEAAQHRGTSTQRGYGRDHQQQRAAWAPYVNTGQAGCARCGQPIRAGQPWDLGHTDDRTAWTGPEHARCNRSAGGKAGHRSGATVTG